MADAPSKHRYQSLAAAQPVAPIEGQWTNPKGSVVIEDNVWIGAGAVIALNVRIGRNSVIGANAFVNHDIPENSVAAGIPARVIKSF